ncbi:MAG: hypothetical protein ABIP89_23515 [Polyangiaceae bacterium]
MPIIGDHPEVGIRFVLDRGPEGPPYVYEGAAFTPDLRFDLKVTVETDGTVTVAGDAPADVREKARLMVRTMVRHAKDEDGAPPRRIMRWRAPQT